MTSRRTEGLGVESAALWQAVELVHTESESESVRVCLSLSADDSVPVCPGLSNSQFFYEAGGRTLTASHTLAPSRSASQAALSQAIILARSLRVAPFLSFSQLSESLPGLYLSLPLFPRLPPSSLCTLIDSPADHDGRGELELWLEHWHGETQAAPVTVTVREA